MTPTRVPLRPGYAALPVYDPPLVACEVDLADNTLAAGPPPAARRVLRATADAQLLRYPTCYSRELREAFARYVGVAPEEVLVAAGSDQVLDCAFRALAEPGSRVAYMSPTFVMARVFAEANGLVPAPVPLTSTFDADADGLLAERAVVTYLCTPNNPTGTALQPATLARVAEQAAGVVLVDEAYAEFAGTNLAADAPARDGMLVLRTCSKAFGLAGLRVGFAVGARQLIRELEKARGPYAVTSPSEQAALAVFREDLAWVQDRVAEIRATRDQFVAALQSAGWAPLPSVANFVLLPTPEAETIAASLLQDGIRVRVFTTLHGIGPALRITIGTPDVMRRVTARLGEATPCA